MKNFTKRSLFPLLALCLSYTAAQNTTQDTEPCKDAQAWCPSNTHFCNTVPEILSLCPKTCGTCNPIECKVCEHTCKVLPDKNIQCSCLAGYKLATDNTSCVDINECVTFPCDDPKEPHCNNFPGGYQCTPSQCAGLEGYTDFLDRGGCCQQNLAGTCGKNVQNKDGRIFGGEDAVVKMWPWVAHIMVEGKLCGGSLINNQWVVTAAHCFNGITHVENHQVDVRFGVHDVTDFQATYIQKREAVQLMKQDNFAFPDNDIALLKLNSPVEFSDWVSPVCLPNGHVPSNGTRCFVAGYGLTDEGETARVLQQVVLSIVDKETCSQAFEGTQEINKDTMMCAGYKDGNKDACRGDSGGPLMCQRCNNCDWYLAGVISFGKGCATPNFYGVYADVEYFEEWIALKVPGLNVTKGSCTGIVSFGPWTSFSPCLKSCGGGEKFRTRTCSLPDGNCLSDEFGVSTVETTACNTQACYTLGKWGTWQECDVTCGGGRQNRVRTCPEGSSCSGQSEMTRSCNTNACARWTNWTEYGACSASCGGGTRNRTRICVENGSTVAKCSGSSTQSQNCNTDICPPTCSPYCKIAVIVGFCYSATSWMSNYCKDCCRSGCVDTIPDCAANALSYCTQTDTIRSCVRTCGYCLYT